MPTRLNRRSFFAQVAGVALSTTSASAAAACQPPSARSTSTPTEVLAPPRQPSGLTDQVDGDLPGRGRGPHLTRASGVTDADVGDIGQGADPFNFGRGPSTGPQRGGSPSHKIPPRR